MERVLAFYQRLLERLASSLSRESTDWINAMLAETPRTQSAMERASWIAGAFVVALRFKLRDFVRSANRPLAISFTSIYLAAFSIYLFAHTALQIPLIREHWPVAWFPVFGCLCLTLLPAVFAFGLWTCDNLARKLVLGFIAYDIFSVILFTRALGITDFRIAKLVIDLFIVVAMMSPKVIRACRCSAADLSLRLSN